jgi:hypothetical protein
MLLISNGKVFESASNNVTSNDLVSIFHDQVVRFNPAETVNNGNNVTVTLCLR